ncbi:ABC transporter ATP-binding protein [Nocardioides sp. 31GB23]|uniref:ABC transporter ATP-binding protein n=1 Tax=Nocardioides sp. 31GB23 TaxID=3156065 RepID=UPI0032AF06E1
MNLANTRSRGANLADDPRGDGNADSLTPAVSVRDLRKSYKRRDGEEVLAVDSVTLDVAPGEFVVLLGPSGCGKSTLLRCIAGLEQPHSGTINLHGHTSYSSQRRLDDPPEKRNLGMMFQSYALWPHMTVFDNVAYPLRARKAAKNDVSARVERVLEMIGIPELGRQYPGQMSGGQQQRVALARALVSNEGLILFDEPLSNVDAKVREQLRLELVLMQRDIGFAAIYVTHDQIEAMELADRIAVMQNGKVAQCGTPREIYETPSNQYVGRFVGSTNELNGRVTELTGDDLVRVDTQAGSVLATRGSQDVTTGAEVSVMARPEKCRFETSPSASVNAWEGTIAQTMFLGTHVEHLVKLADSDVTFLVRQSEDNIDAPRVGDRTFVSAAPEHLRALSS